MDGFDLICGQMVMDGKGISQTGVDFSANVTMTGMFIHLAYVSSISLPHISNDNPNAKIHHNLDDEFKIFIYPKNPYIISYTFLSSVYFFRPYIAHRARCLHCCSRKKAPKQPFFFKLGENLQHVMSFEFV